LHHNNNFPQQLGNKFVVDQSQQQQYNPQTMKKGNSSSLEKLGYEEGPKVVTVVSPVKFPTMRPAQSNLI
jgi:hypothetical protein